MKKVLLLTFVAFLASSCRKDYTCTCTENYGSGTFTSTSKAKSTKKSAEEWCKGIQHSTFTDSGSTSIEPWVCTVK